MSTPEGVARHRWRCARKASVRAGREARAAFRAGTKVLFLLLLLVAAAAAAAGMSVVDASGPEGIGSPVGRSMGFSAVELGSAIIG